MTIFTPLSQRIVDRIEATDVNSLTPLQALNLLEELQQELKERGMTAKSCARGGAGSLLVVGLGRHGADWPGTRMAQAGAAGRNHSLPAQYCRCAPDAGAARRGYCACARRTALRCVDVEGGTVDRLRDALAPMPSAQAVAQRGCELAGNARLWRASMGSWWRGP